MTSVYVRRYFCLEPSDYQEGGLRWVPFQGEDDDFSLQIRGRGLTTQQFRNARNVRMRINTWGERAHLYHLLANNTTVHCESTIISEQPSIEYYRHYQINFKVRRTSPRRRRNRKFFKIAIELYYLIEIYSAAVIYLRSSAFLQ